MQSKRVRTILIILAALLVAFALNLGGMRQGFVDGFTAGASGGRPDSTKVP